MGLIFVVVWFVGSSELSLSITDSSPIFNNLLLLSSHFDEESSAEYFFIIMVSDEINGVNSHFEDDFKGSGIIIFDFDEVEVREGFLYIFLGGIEITLDKI